MCEIFLKRYKGKGFLHRIVTGDEMWITYDNSKCQEEWVRLGEAAQSKPKANIHSSKLMLFIWWDQGGVIFYEALNRQKPSLLIATDSK